MSSYYSPSNKPKQSPEDPPMLRMLHPTSGRQGFNAVNNQAGFPSPPAVDPRFAMMLNAQTQQAIAASGLSTGFPYQGSTFPQYSPNFYGVYQPYPMYPRRS